MTIGRKMNKKQLAAICLGIMVVALPPIVLYKDWVNISQIMDNFDFCFFVALWAWLVGLITWILLIVFKDRGKNIEIPEGNKESQKE